MPSGANNVAMLHCSHVRWGWLTERCVDASPGWQVSDCLLDHLPEDMEDNVGPPQLDIASAVSAVTTNASTAPEEVRMAEIMLHVKRLSSPEVARPAVWEHHDRCEHAPFPA